MDKDLRYDTDRVEPEVVTFMNFDDNEGILRLAESCNGSGDCRKTEHSSGMMCPSYHATRDEKDSTRGRANVLREVLTNGAEINSFDSEELKESLDLCISCKACASECPSNVNMAAVKAEFQYQYNRTNKVSLATKLIGRSSKLNKRAARFPRISNWIFRNSITSSILKKLAGIAKERSIPLVSSKCFSKVTHSAIFQEIKDFNVVYLYIDEFSNYLEAEVANDAYNLLTRLGYTVHTVDHLDSARALISKGFLEEAKKMVDMNIAFLRDKVSENAPLLGIEPSAILGFRDEYLRLADDITSARDISKHTYLIEEFISAEAEKGLINEDQFTTEAKRIKIHAHCHQKALSNQKVTFDALNLPKNFKPTIIPSGCCGMAGGFGYEKEHYEISMKIGGLKLFPAVKKCGADVIISANGTSCRHQIMDGTGRVAQHPITILRNALK
jgi:Fe-S oxidoreductase